MAFRSANTFDGQLLTDDVAGLATDVINHAVDRLSAAVPKSMAVP